MAFLSRVWDERGPFDGLLGFSQGAAMASVFHQCVFGSGSGSRLGPRVDKANCAGSTGEGLAKTERLLSVRALDEIEGAKTSRTARGSVPSVCARSRRRLADRDRLDGCFARVDRWEIPPTVREPSPQE